VESINHTCIVQQCTTTGWFVKTSLGDPYRGRLHLLLLRTPRRPHLSSGGSGATPLPCSFHHQANDAVWGSLCAVLYALALSSLIGLARVRQPLQCTGHSACRGLLACPISLTDFAIPPWQVAGGMHDIYAGTCRYRTSAASIFSSYLSHLHLNKYTVLLSSCHAPLQQPRKWRP
jgi:hypothetical protein